MNEIVTPPVPIATEQLSAGTQFADLLAQFSPQQLREMAGQNTRFRRSLTNSHIARALVQAGPKLHAPPKERWREVTVQPKDGSKLPYKFKYAELDTIMEVVRPALHAAGLILLTPISQDATGKTVVLAHLLHESGEWMEVEVGVPPPQGNMQVFGGVVTYMRRYSVSALLNIAGEEDDDANSAMGNRMQDEKRPPQDAIEVMRDAAVSVLAHRGRVAAVQNVDHAYGLLVQWEACADIIEPLRGTDAWTSLIGDVSGGLNRALGKIPAVAWKAAVLASTPNEAAKLEAALDEQWGNIFAGMERDIPNVARLLRMHIRQNLRRIEATAARSQESKPVVEQAGEQTEQADQKPTAGETPKKGATESQTGGLREYVDNLRTGKEPPSIDATVSGPPDSGAENPNEDWSVERLPLIGTDGNEYVYTPTDKMSAGQSWAAGAKHHMQQKTTSVDVHAWWDDNERRGFIGVAEKFAKTQLEWLSAQKASYLAKLATAAKPAANGSRPTAH